MYLRDVSLPLQLSMVFTLHMHHYFRVKFRRHYIKKCEQLFKLKTVQDTDQVTTVTFILVCLNGYQAMNGVNLAL